MPVAGETVCRIRLLQSLKMGGEQLPFVVDRIRIVRQDVLKQLGGILFLTLFFIAHAEVEPGIGPDIHAVAVIAPAMFFDGLFDAFAVFTKRRRRIERNVEPPDRTQGNALKRDMDHGETGFRASEY